MSLSIVKTAADKKKFVLLPLHTYETMRSYVPEKMLAQENEDYLPFEPADYIESPIALRRIKAGWTQKKLAKKLKVSQAYISKVESQKKASAKLMMKVDAIFKKIAE